VQPSGKINESFGELASLVTGRAEPRRQRSTLFEPIIAKLSRRKA
jgi:pilus assembly protein CpaE